MHFVCFCDTTDVVTEDEIRTVKHALKHMNLGINFSTMHYPVIRHNSSLCCDISATPQQLQTVKNKKSPAKGNARQWCMFEGPLRTNLSSLIQQLTLGTMYLHTADSATISRECCHS